MELMNCVTSRNAVVGDSSGRFNPDQAVDKFYTVKVLAKAAGFKYVNLTASENAFIADAYEVTGGTPHLDGTYTVFGEVIEGLEVVRRIQLEATDAHDRPLTDVVIKKATLEKR